MNTVTKFKPRNALGSSKMKQKISRSRAKFKTHEIIVEHADKLVERVPKLPSVRRNKAIIFKCAIFALQTIRKSELQSILARLEILDNNSEKDSSIEVFMTRPFMLVLKESIIKIERHYDIRLTNHEALVVALLNIKDIKQEELNLLIRGVRHYEIGLDFKS